MNSLKNMSARQKALWSSGALVLVAVAYGLDEPSSVSSQDVSTTNQAPMEEHIPTAEGGFRNVQVYDQGLGMVSSTVTVPADWTVQQDIAYNPNTGLLTKFKLVAIGPRNQYIRSYAGSFPYGSINNVPYDQAVRAAIDHVIGVEQLENIQFGQLSRSPTTMRNERFQEVAQRLANRGQRMEAYEAEFTGSRHGKQYKGRIIFTNMFNPGGGFGILTPAAMIFSLAEDYEDTVQIADAIDNSRIYNPQYSQAMAQISQRVQQNAEAYSQQMMNQSAIAHQKRMADRQAAFASHQKNMAGLNQLQAVAHENYMKTLRSSGSFSSIGPDYSSHNAVVDQIHERSTFQDPWSEQPVNLDGQFDYNYTNGLGDYYRTNDPSFEPASLQGNWTQITPLGP